MGHIVIRSITISKAFVVPDVALPSSDSGYKPVGDERAPGFDCEQAILFADDLAASRFGDAEWAPILRKVIDAAGAAGGCLIEPAPQHVFPGSPRVTRHSVTVSRAFHVTDEDNDEYRQRMGPGRTREAAAVQLSQLTWGELEDRLGTVLHADLCCIERSAAPEVFWA